MYRCGVCGRCSKPGEDRKTAVVLRQVPPGVQYHRRSTGGDRGQTTLVSRPTPARTEIAREVALCGDCNRRAEAGATVRELEALYRTAAAPVPAVTLPIRLGQPARVSRPDRAGPPGVCDGPTGGPAS